MNNIHNKRIWLHSLGCRTNQSEKESIASGLIEHGAVIENNPQNADAAIIFTCSVTSTADKKSRQCIRMARRNIPSGIIVACGCWAQRLKEDEAKELGIDLAIGNRQKHLILGLLEKSFGQEKTKDNEKSVLHVTEVWNANNVLWDELPIMRPVTRSRAFIKIQDGCNRFCSYCIVPFLRGRPVSRPLKHVIGEINNVIAFGCKEIILTGTNLGDYHCEEGEQTPALSSRPIAGRPEARPIQKVGGISALIEEIAKIDVKLQFGSIEPFSINEDFLNAVHKLSCENKFSPPLHVPLQSGDDVVLARMKRGYTGNEYLSKIKSIRDILGEIPISTDLIVGFPGETDEAFRNSVDILKTVGFCKVHVFPYSPRENTLAAGFEDQVPKEIILKRVNSLN